MYRISDGTSILILVLVLLASIYFINSNLPKENQGDLTTAVISIQNIANKQQGEYNTMKSDLRVCKDDKQRIEEELGTYKKIGCNIQQQDHNVGFITFFAGVVGLIWGWILRDKGIFPNLPKKEEPKIESKKVE